MPRSMQECHDLGQHAKHPRPRCRACLMERRDAVAVTADNITYEQLFALRLSLAAKSNWDWVSICDDALNSGRADRRAYCRQQCADLINARNARSKETK